MPNHVRNVIHFDMNAPVEAFQAMLEKVITSEGDDGPRFDFNSLIPMPKELDIASGSQTDEGMTLVAAYERVKALPAPTPVAAVSSEPPASMAPALREDLTPVTRESPVTSLCWDILAACQHKGYEANAIINWMKRANLDINSPSSILEFARFGEGKKMYDLGKIAMENEKKYGAPTWYEWCYDHWGTKWNAYECEIDPEKRKISFSTAWNTPDPIVVALSAAFPDVGFQWLYADEDCGANTGGFISDAGELNEYRFNTCSDEAYEVYVACWGADQCMYKNEDGKWRRYNCDECPHPC